MSSMSQPSSGQTTVCGCTNQPVSDEELFKRLDEIIDSFEDSKGILIPALQTAQNLWGYLPEQVLKHLSLKLKVPYSEVTGVVTFYSFFSTVPRGKHVVRVCLGTACYVRGGNEVLEAFRKHLGINVGETTEDRLFSLEVGRCFGACGLAPTISIDGEVYKRVRPIKVGEIIDSFYKKEEEQGASA